MRKEKVTILDHWVEIGRIFHAQISYEDCYTIQSNDGSHWKRYTIKQLRNGEYFRLVPGDLCNIEIDSNGYITNVEWIKVKKGHDND